MSWPYLNHLFERLPHAKPPADFAALLPHVVQLDTSGAGGAILSLSGRLRSGRHAIKGRNKSRLHGDEKAAVLKPEGLITASPPRPEVEASPADEAAPDADKAASTEAS